MTRKLIWFFLLLCFFAVSGLAIFANRQKNELTKSETDYLKDHFMPQYHRLDLRSLWLTKIPNICQDYTGSVLLDIRSIDLWDNKISSVDVDLSCLILLQELDLSYNNIDSIEKLGNLSNLISLQLQNNQIKKISDFENMEKLLSLNLWYNQITSLAGLEKLSQLQELQLSHNHISDISAIKSLKNLEILKIESNNISFADKEYLKSMRNIQDLNTD